MQVFPKALVQSRTCYKHLAGEIGVAVTRALLKQGCIENAAVQQKHCFTITPAGYKWCAKYGIAEYLVQGSGGFAKTAGQDFTKSCLDHSHRVPHLAGKLGRAVLTAMLEKQYCKTGDAQGMNRRGIIVTKSGVLFLHESLGINWCTPSRQN